MFIVKYTMLIYGIASRSSEPPRSRGCAAHRVPERPEESFDTPALLCYNQSVKGGHATLFWCL